MVRSSDRLTEYSAKRDFKRTPEPPHVKSGKPLARYFPEVVRLLRSLPQKRFVLDGELVIQEDATFSFDSLQMRLHPAESRVRKLSQATPATFILSTCCFRQKARASCKSRSC